MRYDSRELSRYLNEIGVYPLLEPEREFSVASELKSARAALERAVHRFPRHLREEVLPGTKGRPREWPYEVACAFRDGVTRRSRGLAAELRESIPDLVAQVRRFGVARETLVRSNLRLVVQLARQHLDPDVGLIDLIQEGNLGLIKAVERFDPDLGNRFSTYAFWWIKQSIERAVKDKKKLIRLPSNVEDLRRRARRVAAELAHKLGRKPRKREVAEVVGIPVDRLREILRLTHQVVDPTEDTTWLESVADDKSVSPYRHAEMRDLARHVRWMLAQLSPREQEILRLRFGIDGDERGLPLREVGRAVEISRERVRQIAIHALKKLRRLAPPSAGLGAGADA